MATRPPPGGDQGRRRRIARCRGAAPFLQPARALRPSTARIGVGDVGAVVQAWVGGITGESGRFYPARVSATCAFGWPVERSIAVNPWPRHAFHGTLPARHSRASPFHRARISAMALHDSILDTIGRTPVVRLHRIAPANVELHAKVESFNPGGSVKDRLALAIILDAEAKGLLKPGDTVVEATSGNTGVALAMVCAARGYKFVAVMVETFSIERRKLMRLRRQGSSHARRRARQRHGASRRGAGEATWLVPRPPVREQKPIPPTTGRPPPPRSCAISPVVASTISSPAGAPAARSPASAKCSRSPGPT